MRSVWLDAVNHPLSLRSLKLCAIHRPQMHYFMYYVMDVRHFVGMQKMQAVSVSAGNKEIKLCAARL